MNEAPKQSSQGWRILLLMLALSSGLALAAAGYGVYWGWQEWRAYRVENARQLAAMKAATNANLATLEQRLQQREQQQKQAVESQREFLRGALQEQYDRLHAMENRVQQIAGLKNGHWYISEADYLIRMAARKLWLEKDSATAINLLLEADQRLSLHREPALLPVRQALADDVAALQTLQVKSEMDAALTLQALHNQVAALHMPLRDALPDKAENATTSSLWQKLADWVATNLVRISYSEQAFTPYLNQRERWLIAEQLKFHILAAQAALLRQQLPLYRHALADARSLVTAYYDVQTAAVIAFEGSLQELATTDFGGQYPSRFAATDALSQYLGQAIAKPSMTVESGTAERRDPQPLTPDSRSAAKNNDTPESQTDQAEPQLQSQPMGELPL